MTLSMPLLSSIGTAGLILLVMAVVATVETAIPLHARGRWNAAHLAPNLALTFITFATNTLFNVALVMALMWQQSVDFGLLPMLGLGPLATGVIAVVVLDFSSYVAHFAMHKISGLWRFHSVHHSDPAVDVTTAIRQHPGESVIRYAFTAAFAAVLGASPAAFALYRVWSALQALLEHANIRVPQRFDSLLSLVVATPNMHKVHHSRLQEQTDTNYGNIFALFDRLFRTFTASKEGVNITYGLEGLDDPGTQSTAGLLALPFRGAQASAADAAAVAAS